MLSDKYLLSFYPFLISDACLAIPKLLIAVGGKALITLSLDISNNISKIQIKQKLHPSKSDTLQSMIHLEIGIVSKNIPDGHEIFFFDFSEF